jgi:hypothetical protein
VTDYVYAPTPAQIAEHIDKGGKVDGQSPLHGTWERTTFGRSWWAGLTGQDTPRHGYRLVPIPPRTVTVEMTEDDAHWWADALPTPGSRLGHLVEACRKALGES